MMLTEHRFQIEFVGAVHRLLVAQGVIIEFDKLQRILVTTGNWLALVPALDESRLKHEWYAASVEAMGGS